ncbi:MAG: hypothetical protein LBQ79_07770 [Deltaproteobacteria bacterium]|jgi:hypothetical protein|nr:hypothetical protein [Deltaproteobacteria bacterium]
MLDIRPYWDCLPVEAVMVTGDNRGELAVWLGPYGNLVSGKLSVKIGEYGWAEACDGDWITKHRGHFNLFPPHLAWRLKPRLNS